jgi:hypothetical protein
MTHTQADLNSMTHSYDSLALDPMTLLITDPLTDG